MKRHIYSFLFALWLFLLIAGGKAWCLTLSEIESRIRVNIRDTATDSSLQRYSDTTIDGFINEGAREVVAQTDALDGTTTYSLTASVTFYVLPSDLNVIKFAYFRKNSSSSTYTMEEKSERSFRQNNPDWQKASGDPVNYFTRSSSSTGTTYEFAVYPIPSTTAQLGTITFEYIKQSTNMTSDSDIPFDSLDFMTPYHISLINYATARIKMIEGRADEATMFNQLYLNDLNIIATKLGRKINWNPSFSVAPR